MGRQTAKIEINSPANLELESTRKNRARLSQSFGNHLIKQIFLTILCMFLSGCVTQYDERLIGSWRSDREGTVAEYNRRFPKRFEGKSEKKEKFERIFGNLTHIFTLKDMTVEYEDSAFTVGYKVLKLQKDYVLIKTYGEDGEEVKIRFVDNLNSYWVNEDSDFPEKFTKIGTEPQH